MDSISVEGGKYRFVLLDEDYMIEVFRYEEPWLTFSVMTPGYRAIRALVEHAIEARSPD